jgi:hypothetical protein
MEYGTVTSSEEKIPIFVLNEDQWKHIERNDDATFYWRINADRPPVSEEKVDGFFEAKMDLERKKTFDKRVKLVHKNRNLHAFARACIVLCDSKKFLSGTFRVSGRFAIENGEEKRLETNENSIDYKSLNWSFDQSHLIPSAFNAETLYGLAFDVHSIHPSGLVVIAGTTGCGKSDLARDFIKRVLMSDAPRNSSKERFPHVVTFEDPIEGWKVLTEKEGFESSSPVSGMENGICLTAREKGVDTDSLKQSLLDARRQTPSCVYVSEVREPEEWKEVLDFAGAIAHHFRTVAGR